MTVHIQPQSSLLQSQEWLSHNFNRRILNPVTLTFAGRRRSPYAMLRHIGRKSGQTRATPVFAVADGDFFYIPLPYGRQADWCQNILAGRQCTIVFQGQAVHTSDPAILALSEAREHFAPFIRWLLETTAGRTGHDEVLRLRRTEVGDVNEYRTIVAQYPARPILRRAAVAGMLAFGLGLLVRRLTRRRIPAREAAHDR